MKKSSPQIYTFILFLLTGIAFSVSGHAQISLEPGASCTDSACHAGIGEGGNNHVLSAQGANCQLCHKPADPTSHRFQPAMPGGETCKQCHAPIIANEHKHVPAAAGMCTTCHRIHRADHPKQLRRAPENLCTTCHSQTVSNEAFSRHLPAVQGECGSCHDPHSSEHNKQLLSAVPELCFGCHDKPQVDEDGSVIPSIEPEFLDDSLNKHPSFARGQCLLCHDPHDSENYRLQRGDYPESFYVQFPEDGHFCSNCHGTKAFTAARTIVDTEFRNGNLNLHYRHVNREKGRNCRACHHHHASDRDALIAHKIPFGKRNIEIMEFAKTDTGGTCSVTCHQTVSYDRLVPVFNDMAVTPRTGTDASIEELLRPVEPPDGAAIYNKRCIGCHGFDAGGNVGPAISGASEDMINEALTSEPMMWVLRALMSDEIKAVAEYLESSNLASASALTGDGGKEFLDGKTYFTSICAACHSADARGGLFGITPDIIGVSRDKIVAAIKKVPMMEALAALGETELQSIADYLSSSVFTNPPVDNEAPSIRGEKFYQARCSACHGIDAEGGLSGTAPAVTDLPLERIQDAIAKVPMMAGLATLNATEIQAIADFLHRIPAATPPVMESDGKTLFVARCAACHGDDASGGLGGMAPGINGASIEKIQEGIEVIPMMQQLDTLTNSELIDIAQFLQSGEKL